MLFKGSFVTEASGSLGGITASHNRGGQYLRARLIPTDPASDRQTVVRSFLGSLTARWLADLSALQRTAWDLYAENTPVSNPLGDPILLSGHQHFVRTNTAAQQGGIAAILDAPIIFGTGTVPVVLSMTNAGGIMSLTFADLPPLTTGFLWGGRPQNVSVSYFRGPFRFVAADATNPVGGSDQYPVAAGRRQWIRTRFLTDDGRLSGSVLFGPITTS